MALIDNAVQEATSGTGTSNLTISAVNGRQRFSEAFSTGGADTFYYSILNQSAAEWEVGTGSLVDANTLKRDTVIASSNGNAAVNFTAGTKDVVCGIPASDAALLTDLASTANAKGASLIGIEDAGALITATTVEGALAEIATSGATYVVGPSSSTDNAVARFDSTTGKLLQNSAVTIDDSGVMAGATIDGGSNTLTVANLSGSTYSTVQHLQDVFHSAGHISGGDITDNADGTVAVTGGQGLIRATNSAVVTLYFFDWSANASMSLTDANTNYVYVDYNGGSPQLAVSTTKPTNGHQYVLLGQVYRSGTDLHINERVRPTVGDHAALMIQSMQETMPYSHVSGAMTADKGSGTRGITVTAGTFWHGLSRFTTAAFDTATGSFDYWYRDGGTGWTQVAAQTAINNTQYDNNSGTLATLSNNKYGVHWVYMAAGDSDIHVVYGQGDYALADAQAATAPSSLPPQVSADSFLIAKIIILKSATSFYSTESAFMNMFNTAGVTSHADLSTLAWTSSGHTGTASAIAGFSGAGAAAEYTTTGTGTQLALSTSPGFTTAANPASNDGASLGISGTAWSDLFLASGAVINWNAGDVTITNNAANTLTFAGASSGYIFNDGNVGIGVSPQTNLAVNGAIQFGGGSSSDFGVGTISSNANWGCYIRGRSGANADVALIPNGGDATLTAGLFLDSSGNVGIGVTSGGAKLDISGGSSTAAAINVRALSAATDNRILDVMNNISTFRMGIEYDNTNVRMNFTNRSRVPLLTIVEANGKVGIGTTTVSGKCHIDQSSATGAVPVLYLDQADVSEEMIQFETTIGTGNAIEAVGAKTLTTTHFIKVTLPGGLTRYIPVGTIA